MLSQRRGVTCKEETFSFPVFKESHLPGFGTRTEVHDSRAAQSPPPPAPESPAQLPGTYTGVYTDAGEIRGPQAGLSPKLLGNQSVIFRWNATLIPMHANDELFLTHLGSQLSKTPSDPLDLTAYILHKGFT